MGGAAPVCCCIRTILRYSSFSNRVTASSSFSMVRLTGGGPSTRFSTGGCFLSYRFTRRATVAKAIERCEQVAQVNQLARESRMSEVAAVKHMW